MHKTFKNQMRYNLDKTPTKPRKHTQVWQEKELSKFYQIPKINTWLKIPLWKDNKWKHNTKWWKYHQGINKPSSLFMMAQGTKTKNVCLPRRHVIGIKNQLKTPNVQKHIGLFPQDLCISYDLAFEYKMHVNRIITLHISTRAPNMIK